MATGMRENKREKKEQHKTPLNSDKNMYYLDYSVALSRTSSDPLQSPVVG